MGFSANVSNLKILIVEDNASFRQMLREKLETVSPSMVVFEAVEGAEALQKVDSLKPELVFMDIHLPGENGIQLTLKIMKRHPNTKIIILTNYDSLEYREAAIRSGGICYIPKDSLHYLQIEKLLESLVE